MSYIPYTYSAPKADGRKQFSFTVPGGGARLKGETLPENTCSYLCNFDISGDGISTRKTVTKKAGQLDVNGTFHGVTKQPFYGRIIFHAGTCLYSYGSTGLSEISGTLPDEKSIMCEFMSKLYIYCKGRVFCVDRDFAVTEQLPDPVLMFENASTTSCRGMKETGTAYNLIAPRVSVTYKGSMPVEAYGGYAYQLPRRADISRPVNVYVDGEEIDAERYRAEETYLHLKSGWGTVLPESLKITFFIKDGEETSFEDFFCGCDLSVSFGGNTNGGTRILMTGNVEKKGYYCRSGVQNPLYFGSDECEVIGDGCENITAVMKMYGYLIIFTESSVFKMTHNVTSDRIYYSVKEISSMVGCDCPRSVQLIDNRVVFANSEKGVFVVDSADDTGEHNIKPLSENINSGDGKGLCDCDAEDVKACTSIDFDRKYMLFVGGKAYIWDYNYCPFYDSGNYSKAQERLCWYIYNFLPVGLCYELENELVIFDTDEMSFFAFSEETDGENVDFCIKSREESFGMPLIQKHVTEIEIMLGASENTSARLLLYADGECYSEKQLSAAHGKKTHLIVSCVPKALYKFAFEICGSGGIKIENIIVKCKTL